jgi:thymidylate synthase ThyX
MGYEAKVLKDSLSPDRVRLTTIEVTLPRIVLAELNTHRMFSRNSASSRAIPVKKMLERVKNDPFIPVWWGKNQKGMQAAEELAPGAKSLALAEWLLARDNAVATVERLQEGDIDLHKQIANRLLEPWLFHTVIVTATEWDNFWGLRRHPDAQPEIKRAADMMWDAYQASFPVAVGDGEWHLPLVEANEAFNLQVNGMSIQDVCKVSVGRCARVSYLTHDGKRDPKADIELCERLAKSGHMSPMEHVATPMTRDQAVKILRKPGVVGLDLLDIDARTVFAGNFRGWVQMRKEVPNEDNFLATSKA